MGTKTEGKSERKEWREWGRNGGGKKGILIVS